MQCCLGSWNTRALRWRVSSGRLAPAPVAGVGMKKRQLVYAVCICAWLLFGALPTARAATINVDSTCTLPQAITSANDDSAPTGSSCEAGSGADTINLSANVTLSADLPQVTTAITIEGGGYTIDGADAHHIFDVWSSGNLTINQVTLINGFAWARSNARGGAVYVGGATLTISRSRITSSSAFYGGGLAVFNSGTATISNTTINCAPTAASSRRLLRI